MMKAKFHAFALLGLLIAADGSGADLTREPAGALADGTAVEAIVLSNAAGMRARILTYGATLQSILVPDRHGHVDDVILGYDSVADYESTPRYFGVTVGRFANRIAGGRFALDGHEYRLTLNDKGNSLHGGMRGFDKYVWRIVSTRSGKVASVSLAFVSPDGDSGYPGELDVTTTYSLDDANRLSIDYTASTTLPTVVNLTNHALFNLAGDGARDGVEGQRLMIPAARYTPVDDALIPTGELRSVSGTVFDFRRARAIADGWRDGNDPQIRRGRGYDHNFVLDKGVTPQPELCARLEDPKSGRTLEVSSTEPGLQLYTGNFLDGSVKGKRGHLYRMGDGIALEPQKFPDSPNESSFPSARVEPGMPYHHTMVFKFVVRQPGS